MLVITIAFLFLASSAITNAFEVGLDGRFLRIPNHKLVFLENEYDGEPQPVPVWVLERAFDPQYSQRMLE